MTTTVNKPAVEMTVVELRNYAQSLGIKNVKNYKKEELVKMTEKALMTSVSEEPVAITEDTIELPVADWDYDISLTMAENIDNFYDIFNDKNLTSEQLVKIFFEKAEEKGFSVEDEDRDRFVELYSKHFQTIDNTEETAENNEKTEETKDSSSEEKSSKKTKKNTVKRTYIPKEKPDFGTQSRTIYDTILQHPSWSHYKIATVLNCTYTNVRRVFQSYIQNKNIEGYEDKRSSDCFRKVKKNK